jgi:hypothetical protein
MRTTTKSILPLAAAAVLAGPWLGAGIAVADEHETTLQADLSELNDSGVTSTAWGTLTGNELHISIESSGLLAESPHAQHIHIGGGNTCPDMSAGTGPNGELSTSDGAPAYGGVKVSLTKEPGMTGADHVLDVANFPVGDETYERTIELPQDVADDVRAGHGVVVIHGVDHNGNGEYDGDRESDLDPSLPAEATDPAACGVFEVSQMADMPEGGVETGGGSTAGLENGGLLALGTLTIGAAAAGLALNRRRNADTTS